jgi:hypothetical protein
VPTAEPPHAPRSLHPANVPAAAAALLLLLHPANVPAAAAALLLLLLLLHPANVPAAAQPHSSASLLSCCCTLSTCCQLLLLLLLLLSAITCCRLLLSLHNCTQLFNLTLRGRILHKPPELRLPTCNTGQIFLTRNAGCILEKHKHLCLITVNALLCLHISLAVAPVSQGLVVACRERQQGAAATHICICCV